jgi:hypothetical protein
MDGIELSMQILEIKPSIAIISIHTDKIYRVRSEFFIIAYSF